MEQPKPESTLSWLGLAPSGSALGQLGARRCAALIVALVMLFIGLRAVNLDADPPLSFGKRAARELVAEPAAKSHEARNYALFDTFHLNEADDYQFWRAQSPVWVYPLTAFFKAFGTDWPQLRLFSTLYAGLGLAALLAIAIRFASPLAVCFVGGLLACDSMYFHYSRAGLLEPAVNTWLAGCMLALILAERRPGWLIAAHWAIVLAFFTKQAALVALPVVLFASVRLLWPGRRADAEASQPGGMRGARFVVIANAVLLCALALLYVLNSDYWRAVAHNVNHVLLGSDAPVQNKYRGVLSVFTRIVADGRYRHFFATVPVTGPLALFATGLLALQVARRRRLPYAPAVLVGWFVCAFGAMLAIAWSALRFWQMVVLPAALVAGFALDWVHAELKRHGRARIFRPVALASALILFGVHAFVLREPLLAPRFTLRDGARAIVQTIGPREATVVGARSPPMVLGTPYKNFYLRAQFNSSRDQLERLEPTHFLFVARGDGSQKILTRELPDVAEAMVPVLLLEVRGDLLQLYAADERLADQKPR